VAKRANSLYRIAYQIFQQYNFISSPFCSQIEIKGLNNKSKIAKSIKENLVGSFK